MSDQTANQQARGGRSESSGPPPLVDRADLAIALVTLAICGVIYWITSTFDEPPAMLGENIGPEQFPRLLVWFIGLLALGLPFEQYFQRRRTGRGPRRSESIKPISVATAVLLIAVVSLMKLLGTVFSMVAVCVLLPPLWGERRWKLIAVFAVLFPAAVTLLFAAVLGVYFEPGIFGGLFG